MLIDLIFKNKKIILPNPNIKDLTYTYDLETSNAVSLFEYSEIKELIHIIKFKNFPNHILFLRNEIIKYINKSVSQFDCLIPMPSTPKSYKIREYDHLRILCKDLANYYKVNLVDNLVLYSNNFRQSHLNKQSRITNTKTFSFKSSIKGKTCILIEDVITTGTTASLAIKELKKYYKSIILIVIAS